MPVINPAIKLFAFHYGGGQGTDRPTQANLAGGRARSPLRAVIMPSFAWSICKLFYGRGNQIQDAPPRAGMQGKMAILTQLQEESRFF